MPGPLVCAIQAVPLPLPRRRLLRGRIARLWSAGARTLHVRAQDHCRQPDDQRRQNAHPGSRQLHQAGQTGPYPDSNQFRCNGRTRRRVEAASEFDTGSQLMASLKKRAIDLYDWFEQRLGLGAPAIEAAEHEVPSNTSSWWYVFGSAATVILVLQVVTGILLALVYDPAASHAWSSLEFLDHNVRLGWFLRAMHGWGSDFMVAIVLIHLVQVFLFGAYKFPRELTWIIGVFLLLLTLGMAFTGQVLRFDQDAYWGL